MLLTGNFLGNENFVGYFSENGTGKERRREDWRIASICLASGGTEDVPMGCTRGGGA